MNAQLFIQSGSTVGTSTIVTIGKYDAVSGAALNTSLVTGLDPGAFAYTNNELYVVDYAAGTLSTYDATTGSVIRENFITGLAAPSAVFASGDTLYVATNPQTPRATLTSYDAVTGQLINSINLGDRINSVVVSGNVAYVGYGSAFGGNSIETVDATTLTRINQSLVSGLSTTVSMAVLGNTIYLQDATNRIETYDATTGQLLNANFITGVSGYISMSSDGERLYAENNSTNTVGAYDPNSGQALSNPLISGISNQEGIVAGIPEPNSAILFAFGLGAFVVCNARTQRVRKS